MIPLVVVAAGHMIDAPDRLLPRFPPSEEHRVAREIRGHLEQWCADNPALTVICGGASGADIVVAEQALGLGATVKLCLAQPSDSFVETSVGHEWAARFGALVAHREVTTEVLPEQFRRRGDIYSDTNAWMIRETQRLAPPHRQRLLAVWDGAEGDGPGGTRDLLRLFGCGADDDRCRIVHPTRRDN